MSLNQKQAEFTSAIAKLIVWANGRGIHCIGAELFRTPEQAEIYARQGKGIRNSVHTKKLALDLFILGDDGKVTWDREPYARLGTKWKQMDDRARWGGDFRNRDSVHFSFEHNGVA